jgi:hypothetical protein
MHGALSRCFDLARPLLGGTTKHTSNNVGAEKHERTTGFFPSVIRKSISAAPREMVIRVSFNPRVDNQIAAKNWFSGARAAPCLWQTAFWMGAGNSNLDALYLSRARFAPSEWGLVWSLTPSWIGVLFLSWGAAGDLFLLAWCPQFCRLKCFCDDYFFLEKSVPEWNSN